MTDQFIALHMQAIRDLQTRFNRAFGARGYEGAKCVLQQDSAGDFAIQLNCPDAGISYKVFYVFKNESDWQKKIDEAFAFIADLPEAGDFRVGKLRERIKEDLEQLDDVTLDQAEVASIRARLESVVESLSSNIIEDKRTPEALF